MAKLQEDCRVFRQAAVSISSALSVSSISKPCTCLIFSALLPGGTESQMLTRELNLHSPSSLIGAGTKTAGFLFSFLFLNGNHK